MRVLQTVFAFAFAGGAFAQPALAQPPPIMAVVITTATPVFSSADDRQTPIARTTKLIVEFAIPGAPTESIDVKILEDSVHLLAPARDIEYVSALALGWPVRPDKAEAIYENGLLRIEVPFKDPMEDAVKVAVKAGGLETKRPKVTSPQS